MGDEPRRLSPIGKERAMDKVRGWMSSPAIVAQPDLVLPRARRLMQERHNGFLMPQYY